MAENGNSSSNDRTKRRKLNSSEMAAEDAPTTRIPVPDGQARQVRPATPSRGQRVQQQAQVRHDATGSVGQRPGQTATPQPNPPRKAQPMPANGSKRANTATLVPPVVKQQAAVRQALTPRRTAMPTRRKVLLAALGIVVLIVGIAAWWVLGRLDVAKKVFTYVSVTPAPEIPFDPTTGVIMLNTPIPGSTPVSVIPRPQPQTEPVTILLLGLDRRPDDTTPPRTDTMILVRVDPITKKVGMLSIPRDLWVTIPGLNEATKDRINAAYGYGEDNHIPGGGPAMAKAAIKYNFGINVDYFAEVDFNGFQKIVDTLGGINVDVPKPLVDNQFPQGNNVMRILIPAGIQHMDGTTALEYARSRHQDSDLGRNRRQQQVLLAIKEKALDIPNTLSKIDQLLGDLRGSIRTDLNSDQILSLAMLAPSISGGNITEASIGTDMVTETILPDTGADVLIPNWDKIRPLVAQLFGGSSIALEAARIQVLNGTSTVGLATHTAQSLRDKGFNVVGTDNTTAHAKTIIVDYTNKSFTAGELAKALGLDPSVVRSDTGGPPDVDIVVVMGDDKASAAQ
jgi:polyisoprenyl-teichoic acid--peptidoglycan teichoic acid transferase